MLLWIALALLTASVIAAIARPLLRPDEDDDASPASADLEVYRDQLAEIDRDVDRGLIAPAEAEAARVELSRRILQIAERNDANTKPNDVKNASGQPQTTRPLATTIAAVAAAAIPLVSVAIYLGVGAPSLPSQPFAERFAKSPDKSTISELVAKVEARLRDHPEDGKGWDVIAPVYMKLQRFADAKNAFAMARRILGDSPRRLAGFAEASIMAGNGVVTEDAKQAYETLLKQQPDHLEARFWLAQASEQDGNFKLADEKYRALLNDGPKDAPWRDYVVERLRVVAEKQGKPLNTKELAAMSGRKREGEPGPSQGQIAASQNMSPNERAAMIDQMVSGLAEKLKKDGSDLQGWLRLVKAYGVLGRQKEATKALADARGNFKNDAVSLKQLDALANELGLGS